MVDRPGVGGPGVTPCAVHALTLGVLLAVGAGGCGRTAHPADPESERQVRAVVEENVRAFDRGDGRAHCGTFTPRLMKASKGGYSGCVAAVDRRADGARATGVEVRFLDILEYSDDEGALSASFRVDGSLRVYRLVQSEPTPEAGAGRRWLIDAEEAGGD